MLQRRLCRGLGILILATTLPCHASQVTIGGAGINSDGLQLVSGTVLTGAGVGIGQLEPGRPGDPVLDGADLQVFNSTVDPEQVYYGKFNNPGNPSANPGASSYTALGNNPFVPVALIEPDDHATEVAGVIISTDPMATGVATGARLFSAGDDATSNFEVSSIASAQHLITSVPIPLRAMNMSFANAPAAGATLDGNNLFTQFVDWSAREHDVLYVASGNQLNASGAPDGLVHPSENYNGMTVARSALDGGVYRRVSQGNNFAANVDAAGARTSVDLLAPGDGILLPTHNPNAQVIGDTMATTTENGSSYAAPHVTGTIALLQEYAQDRIDLKMAQQPPPPLRRWDADAQRHEVMKAVLMNSADKLLDTGDGLRLGMGREVLDTNGDNWLQSTAFTDSAIPLDDEMGVGHLDAARALRQFEGGQNRTNGDRPPGSRVPGANPLGSTIVDQVGWDYANTRETGLGFNIYEFTDPLPANSFVSITLAWDRQLELVDNPAAPGARADLWDDGETFDVQGFADAGFNDLDILLYNAGDDSFGSPVAASRSTESNLEHLFFEIPTAGEYEFWIDEFDSPLGFDGTDYAVAWWAFDGPGIVMNSDFDGNGVIDQADYTLWANNFGATVPPGTGADGNGDGVVNAADYTLWRDAFNAASVAVPEPTTLPLLLLAAVAAGRSRPS